MINLPKKCSKTGKPYLSYSQIQSFLYNKADFMKSYFFNWPIEFTAYIDFGSKLGKAIEKNDFSEFSDEEKETLIKIPRYDEFETEIKLDMGDFFVKGFIDSNTSDLKHLIDYKSGTAKKVSDYKKATYIQPHIYCLGIEQAHGTLPESFKVILVERLGNAFKGEELKLGKEIIYIDVDISERRLQEAKELIYKTAEEISEYYSVFQKLNT